MVDELVARLERAEGDVRACEAVMAEWWRRHAEIQKRVQQMETELAGLRQERIDVYARWWDAREAHSRGRLLVRRLRRRLEQARRRCPAPGGHPEGEQDGRRGV
ncbi:hypothetical protein ACQEU5_14950 [Marinactinospora thermotolerans]|uniref:hypothetical protein n=1 Tax=Marinactinospora thermotolerans TaxID=531310 RepID=UPI001186279F|nr:hypothetical protein [Marinactinospora thermotolerans]